MRAAGVLAQSTITGNSWPSSMSSVRPGIWSTASMPSTIACMSAHIYLPSSTKIGK